MAFTNETLTPFALRFSVHVDDTQRERDVRLMIKRRLLARDGGDRISADVAERKRQLEEMYQELMSERYTPVLKRLRRSTSGLGQ